MFCSNLVLVNMIYSGSCHGAQAHDREPPRFKVVIIHLSFQGTLQLSESEN